ncbi:uncharacterized protein ATC70_008408 [Mucor velutinosus]|uniref:MARVEL domain-containing protein n=1 Tax=Mucor velutinosus TaxID=708070 RepID=A0AAN7DSF3_9FUNG|nr:hypothetical protein ATC70_008408 [Mucor velutinosus]
MSNPFDQNPWQSGSQQNTSGPRFGNAYDDEPAYGNAYNSNNAMPGFSTTGYNNAWGDESNKTQYDTNAYSSPPPPQAHPAQSPYDTAQNGPPPQSPYGGNQSLPGNNDAYRYTGTPYGNQTLQAGGAAGYPQNSPTPSNAKPSATTVSSAEPDPWNGETYHTPNKWRFWFRFGILLTSIGHLGFAAGARPYSGEDVPFYTPACFYYLFAVAILSIIYSIYHVLFYCYRRMTKTPKMNRPIMFAIDLLFAVLWGIGVIVEAVKFKCTDGGKFCNFYNVSIFWGFLAFAAYIFAVVWDVWGACCGAKRRK